MGGRLAESRVWTGKPGMTTQSLSGLTWSGWAYVESSEKLKHNIYLHYINFTSRRVLGAYGAVTMDVRKDGKSNI